MKGPPEGAYTKIITSLLFVAHRELRLKENRFPRARQAMIKAAWRRLALRWHPDKNPEPRGTAEAAGPSGAAAATAAVAAGDPTSRFRLISRAYRQLLEAQPPSTAEAGVEWPGFYGPNITEILSMALRGVELSEIERLLAGANRDQHLECHRGQERGSQRLKALFKTRTQASVRPARPLGSASRRTRRSQAALLRRQGARQQARLKRRRGRRGLGSCWGEGAARRRTCPTLSRRRGTRTWGTTRGRQATTTRNLSFHPRRSSRQRSISACGHCTPGGGGRGRASGRWRVTEGKHAHARHGGGGGE